MVSKTNIEELLVIVKGLEADVLCLQEIYNPKDHQIKHVEKELGAKAYIRPGTNRARGVMTLVKNPDNFKITDLECDPQSGRRLELKIRTENGDVRDVVNMYVPSNDTERKKFLDDYKSHLNDLTNPMLVADWNCIEDSVRDRNKVDMGDGRTEHDKVLQGKNELAAIRERGNLIDTYRYKCPNGQLYTYNGYQGYRSRLDRIYRRK